MLLTERDRKTGWERGGSEGGVATEECPPIHARICDTTCQKPWIESPVGTCDGLCKVDGDAHGSHAGDHVCNKCGYTWR